MPAKRPSQATITTMPQIVAAMTTSASGRARAVEERDQIERGDDPRGRVGWSHGVTFRGPAALSSRPDASSSA
jgi:hypothetical protein